MILWKTADLGYLAVYVADALAKDKLKPGDKSFQAGSLGEFQVRGDNMLLGNPFMFNKENIDTVRFLNSECRMRECGIISPFRVPHSTLLCCATRLK